MASSDAPVRSYHVRCAGCDRSISAAYPFCPWCQTEQPDADTDGETA